MWERFTAEYQKVKGTSTKSSVLDRVRVLLRTYQRSGGNARLDEIGRELTKVKTAWRLLSANPAVKYAVAIAALEEEMFAERRAIATAVEGARRAVSERVRAAGSSGAIGAAAVDDRRSVAGRNAAGNKQRMREAYAPLLSSKKTDPERIREMEAAFSTLCREPKFAKYYLEEVGWTNVRSWATWALRAATPAMLAGATARDATEFLRGLALRAGVAGKTYAERYLLELSIYCQAEADKADVSFVMGQATTLLGVVAGPLLSQALGSGVLGTLAKGAKSGAEIGLTTLARENLVDGAESPTVELTEGGATKVTAMNAMRFTHAWLRHVTEAPGSAAAQQVRGEFGGQKGCLVILDQLSEM